MINIRKVSESYLFYVVSSALSFLILLSRRPDAIANPQFWAEDGKVWYADAYNQGIIYSLIRPEAGYYQTLSRLVAIFAQAFPLAYGPLIFNLVAIAAKILVISLLLSARFSKLIPSIYFRALIAFIYLALPHSFEVHANLTNAQWHLGLLIFLIIIAEPSEKAGWRVFDTIVILISSLSGPLCILILPLACIKFLVRRESQTRVGIVILALGSLVQISSLLTTERPSQQPLGATAGLFFQILSGHIFVSPIIGEKGYGWMFNHGWWTVTAGVIVGLAGLLILAYSFVIGGLELRLFLLFSTMICLAALLSPAVSSVTPQWVAMTNSGAGVRYWVIPIFCLFVTLLFLARNADLAIARYVSISLLLLSLFGIVRDWKYPRFADLDFPSYAAQFQATPAGTEFVIPINPDWEMRLVKK